MNYYDYFKSRITDLPLEKFSREAMLPTNIKTLTESITYPILEMRINTIDEAIQPINEIAKSQFSSIKTISEQLQMMFTMTDQKITDLVDDKLWSKFNHLERKIIKCVEVDPENTNVENNSSNKEIGTNHIDSSVPIKSADRQPNKITVKEIFDYIVGLVTIIFILVDHLPDTTAQQKQKYTDQIISYQSKQIELLESLDEKSNDIFQFQNQLAMSLQDIAIVQNELFQLLKNWKDSAHFNDQACDCESLQPDDSSQDPQ